MKDSALVIVDMLNDFIDGSMACLNARKAVDATVAFIDGKTVPDDKEEDGIFGQFPIIFVCDNHPAGHCSFLGNGGQWPAHCVAGTHGSAIHDMLMPYASEELTFYKGFRPDEEQYSGWQGVNKAGQPVAEILDLMDIRNVYLCGIATEYCVRSTCEDLMKTGMKVHLVSPALAYVDESGHRKALKEMAAEGISIE